MVSIQVYMLHNKANRSCIDTTNFNKQQRISYRYRNKSFTVVKLLFLGSGTMVSG